MRNTSYYLFIFCLFFAPLAFGTVERWSLAVVEVVTVLSFVMLFCSAWFCRQESVKVIGLFPLSLLLIYILIQLIPLPQSIIKVLSPATLDIYGPILESFSHEKWIPISVDRKATLHELMRLTCYGVMYVLTIQLLSVPERLKRTTNLVVFLGAFIAFVAIIQSFTSENKIYWIRQVPARAIPFGPWVNPNQFAGYIELIFPLALALFLFYKPRIKADDSWRERFVSFFSEPGIHHHFFLGFAAILTSISIFISLCRGGILSLLVGGVVFLFLYNLKFPKKSRVTLLMFIVFSWVAVTWFGWDSIVTAFNQSFDSSGRFSDGRLKLWADVIEIVKQFPIFGTGFGAFLAIYPLHKTISDNLIYHHAHNDYLELLTDGGIIGFLLVSWFLGAVLWHGWKMIRVRNDHYSILLGIGAISGIFSLLAHSVTDFNLHNGAVGLYFFFVCGLLIASVNTRFSYYSQGSLLKKNRAGINKLFALFGLLLFISTLVIQYGAFWGAYQYNSAGNIYINQHLAPQKLKEVAEKVKKSVKADPFEGIYYHKLGAVYWYLGEKQEALRNHALAGYYKPLEGAFLQQLGLLSTDDTKSQALIEQGYKRAINKEDLALSYVEWLFWKGRRQEALDIVTQNLLDDYRAIEFWMPLLNAYDMNTTEHVNILPQSPPAWLHFGKYCEQHRTASEADYFFSGAMKFLSNSDVVKPEWFQDIISYFSRQGQTDMALLYTRQAVDRVPEFPEFHLILGDYYFKEGITYRAKEEFERVLILDPGNRHAQQRLRKMGFKDAY